MWSERRGTVINTSLEVQILLTYYHFETFKHIEMLSNLKTIWEPLYNYITSSFPNFPSLLISYTVIVSFFFILLFLNSNKNTGGVFWFCSCRGIVLIHLMWWWILSVQLRWWWWLLAGSKERPLGLRDTGHVFLKQREASQGFVTSPFEKWPIVYTESDWSWKNDCILKESCSIWSKDTE